jgi:translocation and assembly module TamA
MDARLSSENLYGSADFARIVVTGDHIRPLGERSRLLLRGTLGAIRTDDFTKIVPSQRFFAGGDRSVRGYDFESLAPRNALGSVIGGRYMATASIEVDWLIKGDYGAALFYDAGNAANEASMDFSRGMGIGFRWRTPLGMLRVDFAHPLDDPDTNVRLHLTIGTPL